LPALAGIGSIMFEAVQGTVDPNIGAQVLFMIFTTAVLGGIGSAYGALAGGYVLGLVMELSTWRDCSAGSRRGSSRCVALILLLLYRPRVSSGRRGCSDMDFLNPSFWLFVASSLGSIWSLALGLYVQYSLAAVTATIVWMSLLLVIALFRFLETIALGPGSEGHSGG
jgi:uncharacterized membrane protein